MATGKKVESLKTIELTKTHCAISAVGFSHKYRVRLLTLMLVIALLDRDY
jgi:hypothetical protein